MSAALGQRVSTGGGRTVVRDTPHGPCPVVSRRAGQLTCTLHRGHGQPSHALTRWNAPARPAPPSAHTWIRPRSSPGCAVPWPPRDSASPVGCVVVAQGAHRVASPGTALLVASRLWSDALAGCALVSWLRSGAVRLGRGGCAVGAALTRCGGAVVTPFTSGAWPVQVGSPQFFLGQGRGWAVSRAYTYQTPHNCVGHNP